MNKGSWFTTASAQNNPALTAGGKSEADIATPTIDPVLSPKTERATPAPDGIAINAPTPRARNCPLDIISLVGHCVTPYTSSHVLNISPSTNPMKIIKRSDIASCFMPLFLNSLSDITLPNIPPKIGPMIGDTNIDATRTTELFSTKPKKAIILARQTSAT